MTENLGLAAVFDLQKIGPEFDCQPRPIGRDLRACHSKRVQAALEALLADLKSGAKDEVDTVERGDHGSERIIYTALRDADGTYRGVLETVVPLTDEE